MPRIFDNINHDLLTALAQTMRGSRSADFCVGYFNLRGWDLLRESVDNLEPDSGPACRLLVGMPVSPKQELMQHLSLSRKRAFDLQQAYRRSRAAIHDFRVQLSRGAPSNHDETVLRHLAQQLKSGKIAVKLFTRYPLHAKLYLAHREDYNTPTLAFLGSSNLTLAGLKRQGELNTEVSDYDACAKLRAWFDERWHDKFCIDITEALIEVIDQSWAREKPLSPWEIYIKIAWHLSGEARAGLTDFKLPREFEAVLLDYQAAAVKIAAGYLNQRKGVVLGDVVGLGKTLMASALVKIFQDDQSWNTLIICPKNLETMWQAYVDEYSLTAKVLPLSRVIQELPDLRRYRIVIIDESHNLRNREGKRYAAIHDYIARNESSCVLLSATPYNKSFLDLSAQLRLFIPEAHALPSKPERYLRTIGAARFQQQYQTHTRSIAAFEKSEDPDDWRELMRHFLVRRTRSFIIRHYADEDPKNGRKFIPLADGERFYFPARKPRTAKIAPSPQYDRLYSAAIVDLINGLSLPRYGLGLFIDENAAITATSAERKQIDNLSRAGKRLMGFCRTNLFKRLESSGSAFLQSVERHIQRNLIFLHAIDNGLPLPIGSLDAGLLDPDFHDEDADADISGGDYAGAAYAMLSENYHGRYKWLRASLFDAALRDALQSDSDSLRQVLTRCGAWDRARDEKLNQLHRLLTRTHRDEKVLVFSQFADTINYLQDELNERGVERLAAATGKHDNPTSLAHRFSPRSNNAKVKSENEIRVLLSTDVLSEGQNLQDCAIVVNYDIPWAIIRLSQRAGRVDRIGQEAENILCYSFMPAAGIERIIKLRARVKQRLEENGEVVGSDERFFEEDRARKQLSDLYTENDSALDDPDDGGETDLSSHAWQIWQDAIRDDPALKSRIENMPDNVYATRQHSATSEQPEGVVSLIKTGAETDALLWLDKDGERVTDSQARILEAAKCQPNTRGRRRHPLHHALVADAVAITHDQEYISATGGQLGNPRSVRRRVYERLSRHLQLEREESPMFAPEELEGALNDIYHYPLFESARDRLGRQLRSHVTDKELAEMTVELWKDERLVNKQTAIDEYERRILCSLGLFDRHSK